MGLDAAVYADDDCEKRIASVRIGNIGYVSMLRETIGKRCPEAVLLLSKVLYSGDHCGDSISASEVVTIQQELAAVARQCGDDEVCKEFTATFGRITETAVEHCRPITF
jgi:hypothetical protein